MKTPKEEGILCAIGNLCSSLRIETTAQNWHRFQEMSRRTARASGAVHVVCPRLWRKVLGRFHKLCWPIKCVVQGLKRFWAISLYIYFVIQILGTFSCQVGKKSGIKKFSKNLKITKEIRSSGGQMKGDISIPSEGWKTWQIPPLFLQAHNSCLHPHMENPLLLSRLKRSWADS